MTVVNAIIDALVPAVSSCGWFVMGGDWARAVHARRERVLVPVPLAAGPEFLIGQLDALVFQARMVGDGVLLRNSGHVTVDGVCVVYALHSVPQMTAPGPDVDARR